MTTIIRAYLSHDFSVHRPVTGHAVHGFLACHYLGYFRLV